MFQSFFTLLVMLGIMYLPESPRWLIMKNRLIEARDVTARLLDLEDNDAVVDLEMYNVQEALAVQSAGGGFQFKEFFTGGYTQNFRRTMLGVVAQFFQQMGGINLIT